DRSPEFRGTTRPRRLNLEHGLAHQAHGHAGKNEVCLTILRAGLEQPSDAANHEPQSSLSSMGIESPTVMF
ncbi:MAG: hypothetical protein ACYS6W_14210, partial [Planctomycetota bacterium]